MSKDNMKSRFRWENWEKSYVELQNSIYIYHEMKTLDPMINWIISNMVLG